MSEPRHPHPTQLFATLDGLDYSWNPVHAPSDRPHLFSYHITIHNQSDRIINILARKWVLTYETGEVDVIEGEKVIGKTPRLAPGHCFSYSSFHLVSGNARARGAYHGVNDDGELVLIHVPEFALRIPDPES